MLHNQRESDADWRVSSHPTYTNRPKVELQLAGQASALEGRRGVQAASILDQQPAAVPTTFDAVYDPQNPSADWGGFVLKDNSGRKAFNGHASQRSGLQQTEDGIVSRYEKQEWAHRRRADTSSENKSSMLRFGNAGIIGGIECDNRFETESQRFAASRPTARDQLTLAKQAVPRVPIRDPAQARSRTSPRAPQSDYDCSQYSGHDGYNGRQAEPSPRAGEDNMSLHEEGSLLGYRAPPQTLSLVSNLASQILDAVPPQPSGAGAIKKPSKEIAGAIPGYTGYRRRGL